MQDLVLPSQIPWQILKSSALEECLYWLLDSMGAKDLEWRLGGKGDGAADGGRDLQATFYQSGPDGEMRPEIWWIEAKGRSKTVDTRDVQSAVNGLTAFPDVDVMIFATNTQFSNPTHDWVRKWQASNPRPRIRLWDKSALERLICRHPQVAVRLAPEALSSLGRLELLRARFWNFASYPGKGDLTRLWEALQDLELDAPALIALVAGEFANGSISRRPWGKLVDEDTPALAVASALLNAPFQIMKIERAGVGQAPFFKAIVYLTWLGIELYGEDSIRAVTQLCWDSVEGEKYTYSPELRNMITWPVMQTLAGEAFDLCSRDCSRISTDPLTLKKEEIRDYWDRFRMPSSESKRKNDDQVLVFEDSNKGCKMEFDVFSSGCPLLLASNSNSLDTKEVFDLVWHVFRNRRPKEHG